MEFHIKEEFLRNKEEFQNLREESKHFREESKNIREESKHFREESKHFREESKHFREEAKNIREEAKHFREESKDFKIMQKRHQFFYKILCNVLFIGRFVNFVITNQSDFISSEKDSIDSNIAFFTNKRNKKSGIASGLYYLKRLISQ